MLHVKNGNTPNAGRRYMISLHKWRSRIALAACNITLFTTLYAIVSGLLGYVQNGDNHRELFHYFTILSNALTCLAAAFIVPFAIEGIRKKRFNYPRWVALLHYSGAICTTITLIFAVCIIRIFDPVMAFGGANLYLHIICPMMVSLSFFLVETDKHYTLRNTLICLIPFLTYALVYFCMVVLIGESRGGWPDFYHLTDVVPVAVSIPGMLLLAFIVASLMRIISNRLRDWRVKKLTALWSAEAEPVEIKVEIFGLGRYHGLIGDESNATLPLDIIGLLSRQYHLKEEELTRAYTTDLLSGLREKKQYYGQRKRK